MGTMSLRLLRAEDPRRLVGNLHAKNQNASEPSDHLVFSICCRAGNASSHHQTESQLHEVMRKCLGSLKVYTEGLADNSSITELTPSACMR
jgi:hypothetical protein